MNILGFAKRAISGIPSVTSRSYIRTMAIRPAPESVAKHAAATIHTPRDPNTLSNYNVDDRLVVPLILEAYVLLI